MHYTLFHFYHHVVFSYMNMGLVFSHFLLDEHLCCFSLFHCISNADSPLSHQRQIYSEANEIYASGSFTWKAPSWILIYIYI